MTNEEKILDKILQVYTANEIYDYMWTANYSRRQLSATQQRYHALNDVMWKVDMLGYNAGLLARNVDDWMRFLRTEGYLWREKLNSDSTYDRYLTDPDDNFVISEEDFLKRTWKIANCDDKAEFWKILKKEVD